MVDDVDGGGPIVVVVGSEGKGLSGWSARAAMRWCPIPMSGPANAECRGGRRVVLAEIARQRRS